MTQIRSMVREDLPAVASLYERVVRSGGATPPPGLADSFARQQFDQPWHDPQVASLVCERDDGHLAGFLAVYARRIVIDGRPALGACSGPLVADPDAGVVAPGLLLTRAYLNGPQEISVTDGANEVMRRVWTRVGGVVWHLPSITWTRVFAPLSTFAALVEIRRGPGRPLPGRGAVRAVDKVASMPVRRWVGVDDPGTVAEPLTAAGLLAQLDHVTAGYAIRPDYDETYLRWLLDEAGRVESRGPLVANLVRRTNGDVLGWYVAYIPERGIAEVVQVGAREAEAGAVLDDLFHHCATSGAVAVQGRLEPHIVPAVTERKLLLRTGTLALIHAREESTRRAILAGEAFLSRIDGEWWMAPHLDRFDRPAASTPAP